MRRHHRILSLIALLVLALSACNFELTRDEAEDTATPAMTEPPADPATATPAASETFVTITEPAAGAEGAPVVVDPAGFTVAGEQRGSFENNVVVEALDSEGTLLRQVPTTAQGELGEVGQWRVELAVEVPEGTQGRVRAYFISARDGSVVAEDSVDVQYGG